MPASSRLASVPFINAAVAYGGLEFTPNSLRMVSMSITSECLDWWERWA